MKNNNITDETKPNLIISISEVRKLLKKMNQFAKENNRPNVCFHLQLDKNPFSEKQYTTDISKL